MRDGLNKRNSSDKNVFPYDEIRMNFFFYAKKWSIKTYLNDAD